MPRFHFDLLGDFSAKDPGGMPFADCGQAARFADRLADELSVLRPELVGKASVVMTDKCPNLLTYCVAIEAERCNRH
jgi:hypothetical protein